METSRVYKVLITGENSYIGTSVKKWLKRTPETFHVDTISVRGKNWNNHDFGQYDTIFHVAGIAHIKETKKNQDLYFQINRDLAFKVAKKAKDSGVKQFLFLSSMSVYGITTGVINKNTLLKPKTAYGKSKLEAEVLISSLENNHFKVSILRPPMVYGPGCKGNYQLLSKFAKKTRIFPNIKNKRSMIFIDNLSEFVKGLILNQDNGLYFPQNEIYVCTSEMVKEISYKNGKKITLIGLFNPLIKLFSKLSINQKVFGDLYYDDTTKDFVTPSIKFEESIRLSEKGETKRVWFFHHYATPPSLNGFTRPYYFSKELNKSGYSSRVFTSSYLHFANEQLIKGKSLYLEKIYEKIPFVFVKTTKGNQGIKRIFNMISFYFNLNKSANKLIKNGEIPDYIIASSPHPLSLISGIKIATKLQVPIFTEVRDFWPEVLFINGVISEKSLLGRILLRGERWIYEKSTAIIFLKEGDYQYIVEKKWDTNNGGKIDLKKTHYINNGINIDEFDENANKAQIADDDLLSNKFKVTYAGSLRPVNDVQLIVETANLLKANNDILFLIYGEGSQEEQLKILATKYELENIKFKGYIDKKYIPYVLCQSTVNVLNYSQSKYNWSRGNSSNKLFEYMASGKPIIATMKMGYSPLEKYNCGISISDYSAFALKSAIEYYYNLPLKTLEEQGINARTFAREYDYSVLSDALIKVLELEDLR